MDVDRILRNTPSTLTVTFYNDDTAVDADGEVTVTVTDVAGNTVDSGVAAQGTVGDGIYTFNLPAQPRVNTLTVTWAGVFDGAPGTIVTTAEIVGGFYFNLAELRAADASLADPIKFPTAKLMDARHGTEVEFERVCKRAFVPRYEREVVKGEGTDAVWLKWPDASLVFTIDGTAVDDSLFEVDGRWLRYKDGTVWDAGSEYTVEYQHGMDVIPYDVKQAALRRARGRLTSSRGRIDERATVMQIPDFGTFNLSTPGQRGAWTGIPDVDVVLDAYTLGNAGVL